jgi:hypothetical protein
MFWQGSADSLFVRVDRTCVRDILKRATAEFDRNGLSPSAIRRCQREAPEFFLQEGLRVLLEGGETAGHRFLAVLLVNSPSALKELTDRWQFSWDEALTAARQLQRVDQNFDTKLSWLLPGCDETVRPFALKGENAERALELLDEISPGHRIVPILHHLTGHPDQKISSKATLLIGKRLRNLDWVKRVIAHSTDPRLRANAIETMWGLNSPEVMSFFRDFLGNQDNRAVGNAIIGLRRGGDETVAEWLSVIAADPDPKLRMTAAWTIGQIGDATLVPVLTPMAKDRHPDVRRAALKSLRSLHRGEDRQTANPPLLEAVCS